MSRYFIKKVAAYLKHYGVCKLVKKCIERKNNKPSLEVDIHDFPEENDVLYELERDSEPFPLISIIVPVFNAPREAFVKTLLSVKEQKYTKWELCINDAGTESVQDLVEQVFPGDTRVKYNHSDEPLGISLNSNAALKLATGEYVAFLDHDDFLTENSLLYMYCWSKKTGADMVYSDEDKVTEDYKRYFKSYKKPDFNKTLFLSNNYICHFCMIKRSIVEEVGGFDSEYDGAQDYDLFLKCMEKANRIEHVKYFLYHWRVTKNSTSDNPFNKNYAVIAGKKSLQAYFARNNAKDIEVLETDDPGYYQIVHNNYQGIKNDYELIIIKGMKMSEESIEKLYQRAAILGGDVIVPKQIKNGKYFYNGIAKRGRKLTPSLVGKPKWFSGEFNLGITAMEVCIAPTKGILVKKEWVDLIKSMETEFIDNRLEEFAHLTMIYEPAAEIKVKR